MSRGPPGSGGLKRLLRSLAGLAAGMMVMVTLVVVVTWVAMVLAGLDPNDPPTTGYLVMNLGGSLLAAAAAGMVAVAIGRSLVPVVALALLVVVMSIGSATSAAPGQPGWYPLVVGLVGAVGLFGGAMIIGPVYIGARDGHDRTTPWSGRG